MFEKGLFGDLFDINNDGKLDAFEQATEFMVFNEIMKGVNDTSDDDELDTFDDFDDLDEL